MENPLMQSPELEQEAGPSSPPPKAQQQRRERQTKIPEHLKTVKPSAASSSAGPAKLTAPRGRPPKDPEKRLQRDQQIAAIKEARVAAKASKGKERARTATPAQPGTPTAITPAAPAPVPRATEIVALPESEVQQRLGHEKKELMDRLDAYGIRTHPDVLDRVLATMSTTEPLSIESFVTALRAFEAQPSASTSAANSAGNRTPTAAYPSHLPTPPQTLARAPTAPRQSHVQAQAAAAAQAAQLAAMQAASKAPFLVKTPVLPDQPVIKQLATPPPTVESSSHASRTPPSSTFGHSRTNSLSFGLVAAEIPGMGRVACRKDFLADKMGAEKAQEAISAALDPAIKYRVKAFGDVEAKGVAPFAFFAAPEESSQARPGKEGLSKLQAWLASPDPSDDGDAGDAWSTIPREWDAELEQFGREQRALASISAAAHAPADDFERVVQASGKSVNVLLRTKKRRLAEFDDHLVIDDNVSEPDDSPPTPALFGTPVKRVKFGSPQRQGRSPQRPSPQHHFQQHQLDPRLVSACVCGRGEEKGGQMVQCESCSFWYHLSCLKIPSAHALPQEWFCFRCQPPQHQHHQAPPHPSMMPIQRPRSTSYGRSQTPIDYRGGREPTLVEGGLSPRPRGNFYRNGVPDLALAPSPQTTSSKRFMPKSPVVPYYGAAPLTPRADYSPRSPMLYRAPRARMISTTSNYYDDYAPHGAAPSSGNGWPQQWENQPFAGFGDDHLAQHHGSMEDEWHNIMSTPSRGFSGQTPHMGWGIPTFSTPNLGHARRQSHYGGRPQSGAHSASQEFLSGLHYQQQQQPGHGYLPPSPRMSHPPTPSHLQTPSRAGRGHHRRTSSFTGGAGDYYGSSFQSPRQTLHQRHSSKDYAANLPKISESMARSESSGLGISGFGEPSVGLNDILAI